MNKILLIIEREFMSRVRKKSFIIMTLLGPILFGSLMVGPMLLAMYGRDDSKKTIVVLDESRYFTNTLAEKGNVTYNYIPSTNLDSIKNVYKKAGFYGVLYIGKVENFTPASIRFFSQEQPSIDLLSNLESSISKELEKRKLAKYNIPNFEEILKDIKTDVSVRTIQWKEDGSEKEGSTHMAMAVAYICGFAIYMFIFIFGAQVMRGVIEEKTSRIVEVVISSVKPFQLMMGKILGIAAVALTQLIIWVVLTSGIVMVAQSVLLDEKAQKAVQNYSQIQNASQFGNQMGGTDIVKLDGNQQKMVDIMVAIKNINLFLIIGAFIFFFLFGYLLYSAMFAAIGAAVDNETETQQFMLPVTIPLIFAIIIMMQTFQNPNGALSLWCSYIPFTSPIIMMARVPFGVSGWEILISGIILVASFIGMTWLSSKIYRVGILMYGKKTSWKEMLKWIRYKS
ncbi:MAG: ABC transporter permease [Bacteroidales bacterium]|nr:ABC transporter permease [Bacteroidales bacterium]